MSCKAVQYAVTTRSYSKMYMKIIVNVEYTKIMTAIFIDYTYSITFINFSLFHPLVTKTSTYGVLLLGLVVLN
jgi:hypothetical protein